MEGNQVMVLDHPLIQHKLTLIRDKGTGPKEFRELIEEVALLMAYEVTRDLRLEDVEVETPVGPAVPHPAAKIGRCSYFTGGLGMVDGILKLIPTAKVGHIGIYRDPVTLKAVDYYCKLPEDIEERVIILVDPMLATGVSAAAAIDFLKEKGAGNIKLVCLIAAPEGLEVITENHPDVEIYVAAIDHCLNEHAYIVPGLGDAGDRLYGTK